MEKGIYFLGILVLLVSFNVTQVTGEINGYTSEEVWQKIILDEAVLVIDTRSESQYIYSHIPTAIDIDFFLESNQSIVNIISSYDRGEIILYCSCSEGSSAKNYAELIVSLDYENISYMKDNFIFWSYQKVKGSEPGSVNIQEISTISNDHNILFENFPILGLFVIFNSILITIIITIVWVRIKS